MIYKSMSGIIAVCAALLTGSSATAQEGHRALYVGIGGAGGEGPSESDATPWSIGGYASTPNKVILGFDFAQEGTSFDWTANRGGAVKQGQSFNFLLGYNLARSENFNFDAALLVGFKETEVTCPSGQSVLGFQCWADYDPESDYELNYGVLLTTTIQRAVLGIRATGESVQGIVGWRF